MNSRSKLVTAAVAVLAAGGTIALHTITAATADPTAPTFTVAVQSPATVTGNRASVPVSISCTNASYAYVDVRLIYQIGRQSSTSTGSTSTSCSTTPQIVQVVVPNWYPMPAYAVATVSGYSSTGGSASAGANINVN